MGKYNGSASRHMIIGIDASVGASLSQIILPTTTVQPNVDQCEFSDESLDRLIEDLRTPEILQGQYVSTLPDCEETDRLRKMLSHYDLSLEAGDSFRDARLPVPSSNALLRVHTIEVMPYLRGRFPRTNYDHLLIDYLNVSFENRRYADRRDERVSSEEFQAVAMIYALLAEANQPKLDKWLESLNI